MSEEALVAALKIIILKYGTVAAVISGAICTCKLVMSGLERMHNSKERKKLKELTKRRQAERIETLEALSTKHKLDSEALDILALSTQDLLSKLQTDKLKPSKVLSAYIAKAIEATEKFNCVAKFAVDSVDEAEELDNLQTEKGPLHGLPVCVKEDLDIEGMDTTLGYAKNLYKPAGESAILIKILRKLGAVPFCKTNIPQSLFSYASENPIYGTTVNCHNKLLSPGGSSSGTGCLIGARGALIGTASDIAGSARIPAHFNGVSGLKPTLHRLSGKGLGQSLPKIIGLQSVPGLIAVDAETLAIVFKALVEENRKTNYDDLTVKIPWDNEVFTSTRRLRIGYFTSFRFFPTIGDTDRVILAAKHKFQRLNHTVEHFQMPNDTALMKLMIDLCTFDFGKRSHLAAMFKNEEISNCVSGTALLSTQPVWVRRLIYYITKIKLFSSYSKRVELVASAGLGPNDIYHLSDLLEARVKARDAILKQMNQKNFDLILCPVFPFPACKLKDAGILAATPLIYTMIWNLVEFPAGVCRGGIESGLRVEAYDCQGDSQLKTAKEGVKEALGMPIGIQIVGRPYQEELLLRAMVELERPLPE